MSRRATNDRNFLSSRTLRLLDLSILIFSKQLLRSQISLSQWVLPNLYRLLALYPKTERVSNERPISPGVQGPQPLVFFPPRSPKKAGTQRSYRRPGDGGRRHGGNLARRPVAGGRTPVSGGPRPLAGAVCGCPG